MCGIAGFLGYRGEHVARRMLEKLYHRGPDHQAFWLSPCDEYPITLCHTRLSIIDLSGGAQPFHSSDQRYTLVFNGEIYNHVPLRKELESKNYIFSTSSDTEVLLYGLIDQGIDFLLKCNGMWSFCFWDRKHKSALLARDRFGVKPLYYSVLGRNQIVFASELKVITSVLGSVSPHSHIDFMLDHQFDFEATSHTVIDGINSIPPGYSASYTQDKFSVDRWWNTLDHLSVVSNSYVDHVQQWESIFRDSVSLRMTSDVPIGTALSGGLDSSSVVAMMRSVTNNHNINYLQKNWQHGFCSHYPNSSLDELSWAEKVACDSGVNLTSVTIDPSNTNISLLSSIAFTESPYLTPALPMLQTYSAIKNHGISVSLDGHGSDEMFSGYGHIRNALSCTKTKQQFLEILAIDDSTRTGVFSPKERLRLRDYSYYHLKKLLFTSKLGLKNIFNTFDANPIVDELRLARKTDASHQAFQSMDPFSRVLFELFHHTVLPTLLRNYDRYSMFSGVEVRMPFMDYRLVTYTFSLPWTSKLGGGFTKRIQRDALKGVLGDSIRLRRDKIGWNAPMHEWFVGPWYDQIETLLSTLDINPLLLSKSQLAWRQFNSIQTPTFNDGHRLWNSLLPALWFGSLTDSFWY